MAVFALLSKRSENPKSDALVETLGANLIPSLCATVLLFAIVAAEPNAVVGVLLKPFQNRTYEEVVVTVRIYGKDDYIPHWRYVLPYVLH